MVACPCVVRSGAHRSAEFAERSGVISLAHQRSTGKIAPRGSRLRVLGGPVTAGKCFLQGTLPQMADAEKVPRQSVIRVAIQRLCQAVFRRVVESGLQVQYRHGPQCRDVSRIAGQGQLVVPARLVAVGRPIVPAALEILLLDAQLVIRLLGERRRIRRFHLRNGERRRELRQHSAPLCGNRDLHGDVSGAFADDACYAFGSQFHRVFLSRLSLGLQAAGRGGKAARRDDTQFQIPLGANALDGQIARRVFEPLSETVHGIPPLLPGDLVARIEHAVIGLRRKRSALHFDVGTVVIRQVLLAHQPEVPGAPRPGFLAGQHVMIGNLNATAVQIDMVRAEEIVFAAHGEHGGVDLVVLQPRQVLAFVDRPAEELAPVVIRSQRHRIDEPRAGQIGLGSAVPEIVRMHAVRRIVEPNLLIQVLAPGMQRDAHGPASAEDLFDVVDFEEGRAVAVVPDDRVHGGDNRHRVDLRAGVPLHATADERAAHRDHPRLDHVVPVKDFGLLRLVVAPSAGGRPIRAGKSPSGTRSPGTRPCTCGPFWRATDDPASDTDR